MPFISKHSTLVPMHRVMQPEGRFVGYTTASSILEKLRSMIVCVFGGFFCFLKLTFQKPLENHGKSMAWKMTFLSSCGESWPIFRGVLPMLVSGEGYMFLNFLGCQRETRKRCRPRKWTHKGPPEKAFLFQKGRYSLPTIHFFRGYV